MSCARVERLELDAGVVGREPPGRTESFLIAVAFPSADLCIHGFLGAEPTVRQALSRQDAQFHLGHVEPTAVFGGPHVP